MNLYGTAGVSLCVVKNKSILCKIMKSDCSLKNIMSVEKGFSFTPKGLCTFFPLWFLPLKVQPAPIFPLCPLHADTTWRN